MGNKDRDIGLGCERYTIAVYIGNQPPMHEYQQLSKITALTSSEINNIGQHCGNGWRKVFNVYAKFIHSLDKKRFSFNQLAPTWQEYRDSFLLQTGSNTALLFSAPILLDQKKLQASSSKVIHIIMGRTYAKSLLNSKLLTTQLTWIDDEFAINYEDRVIVCPYFDYRQLSNVKIEKLAELLKELN